MKRSGVKFFIAAASSLTMVALPSVRVAQGCAFQDLATVHFNSFQPDFGTPVRKTPTGFWDSDLWSKRYEDEDGNWRHIRPDRRYAATDSARLDPGYHEYNESEELKAKVDALYFTANKQVQSGQWKLARQTCLTILVMRGRWSGDLKDQVDLLTFIGARTRLALSEARSVKLYFSAAEQERKSNWSLALDRFKRISTAVRFLTDRVNYKYACIAYERNDSGAALIKFRQFADAYPLSQKRENALIMVARICILQDSPDQKTVETGLTAIRQLLASYPHTRFYQSAFGLRARVHFLRHEFTDALWCYYRLDDLESVQLVCNTMPKEQVGPAVVRLLEAYLLRVNDDGKSNIDRDVLAVRQVNLLRNRLSLDMIHAFQQDLKSSPRLVVSYVYYRLYYTNVRALDLANLADLARAATKLDPRLRVNYIASTRLAEVEYQQRHYPQTIEWASRAIAVNPKYGRALFMRASAEEKGHKLRAARADLVSTLAASKDNALRTGARQLLALVSEHQRDFSEALNQYFALGYSLDAAYLLDVRMNTKQIEAYLHHASDPISAISIYYEVGQTSKTHIVSYRRSQMLEYTIAIHLLRQEKWGEACKWLARIPIRLLGDFDTGRREFGSMPSPDALAAVRDLAHLQSAFRSARGYEAKAAAEYRYASYYHKHGALLLYNPILWDGARVISFEEGWNTGCQTPADMNALRNYFASHEVNLRSRELCLAVARRYPRSKIAAQALYRAACASEYAGALAGWFESESKNFRYTPSGEPAALLHRLVRLYPHSPLAPSARKYADVFAAETRPADWPHYTVAGPRLRQDRRRYADAGAVQDAEILLARSELAERYGPNP